MNVSSKVLGMVVTVCLLGGVALAGALGWWSTESTKTPARYTSGAAAGEFDPADIRGSYSFGEISDLFGVPLADLAGAFRVPGDAAAFQVKELENVYADSGMEVGTGSVRWFVAWYRGLPYTSEEDGELTPEARQILLAKAPLTTEQRAQLEGGESGDAQPRPAPEEPTPTALAEPGAPDPAPEAEHIAPERALTGQTTFQQIIDWGVAPEAIEAVLGSDLPPTQTLVKEFATAQGLAFGELKTTLQALVDAAP